MGSAHDQDGGAAQNIPHTCSLIRLTVSATATIKHHCNIDNNKRTDQRRESREPEAIDFPQSKAMRSDKLYSRGFIVLKQFGAGESKFSSSSVVGLGFKPFRIFSAALKMNSLAHNHRLRKKESDGLK
ncbi:hypothetical protein RRG08_061592 [Elysia crispata]|uniref:Uncharacterized protein n=1 Tax=Elysia crispata TaxID=231223 RepID=A0AAE0YT34_9GAST|nr:hypothetical protein RRG08_061592 [Elysia crispata]